jgi:hypothetical protein
LLTGAEEHDVVGLGLVLLLLGDVLLFLAFTDVEDVLFVLGTRRVLPLLSLLLADVGQRRFARDVVWHEGIEWDGPCAKQFPPEARELRVEDGDLLRARDQGRLRRVIDVFVAAQVKASRCLQHGHDLA